jgi:rhamnose utilization protein RhaD (predicted bifunctional aldolase and dehydrogenase)
MIVWGDGAAQCLALVERLQKALAAHFKPVEAPRLHAKPAEQEAAMKRAAAAVKEALPQLAERGPATDAWAQSLAHGGAWAYQPVCPDDVIYAGRQAPALTAEQAAQPARLASAFGPHAKVAVLCVPDHGVLIAAKDARAWRAAHEILHANARARALARTRGQVRPLSGAQGAEILGMKGEQHRQSL